MTDIAVPMSVAVVIPCFNHGRFLPDAVTSVLRQNYASVECVVVNDGSQDDTVTVAARFGVRIINQPNLGVSSARNAGLAAVRTDFVVFLDADDELLPDAVAHGLDALASDPTAAAVVGRCEVMDIGGHPLPAFYDEIDASNLYEEWLSKNFVWTPGAAMFRRQALEAIGGFPAGVGPAADYAVFLTLSRTGRVRFTTQHMVRYRQHETNMSGDPVLMLRATLAVLQREMRDAPAPARRRIRDGRRMWCEWYGEQIVHRLRIDWHAGRHGSDQVRAAITLLRHCRRVVLRHAWRKTRMTAAWLWRHARTSAQLAVRSRRVAP